MKKLRENVVENIATNYTCRYRCDDVKDEFADIVRRHNGD